MACEVALLIHVRGHRSEDLARVRPPGNPVQTETYSMYASHYFVVRPSCQALVKMNLDR